MFILVHIPDKVSKWMYEGFSLIAPNFMVDTSLWDLKRKLHRKQHTHHKRRLKYDDHHSLK